MKYLIIFCVLCTFVTTNAIPALSDKNIKEYFKYMIEKVVEVRNKCEELTGATDDDLEALDEGKIPETETGKCMLACEFTEFGIIDDNKKYNKNGMFEMLPSILRDHKSLDDVKKLTARCEQAVAKVEDGDVCELARKLQLCFKQHESEYGIKTFYDESYLF